MKSARHLAGWTAAGMLLAPSFALASDPAADPAAADRRAAVPARTVPGLGARLDPAALDALRGGEDSIENNVDIRGQVDGNTAHHIASGDNLLDGGAFANASGIATVIQNSGSNVLIQNGMVVNVRFGSGP